MKTLHFLCGCALLFSFGAVRAQETSVTTVTPLRDRPLAQIPAPSPWEKEIAAFEAADKKSFPAPGGVLFIGSSSIRGWRTLSADFPGLGTLNRGFGGSQIADSTRYAPRIVWPYSPAKIVFYAGGNDIQARKSPERVLEDWQSFVATVRQKLPETEIIFLSIVGAPVRWKDVDKVRTANTLIENWMRTQKNLRFVDVFTPLLGEDGQPRPELFQRDRLHMTSAGYAIWRSILAPILTPQGKQQP